MELPILMTEEFWKNSYLSIARFYGGINNNGIQYLIINKDGIDLAELSNPHSKHYISGSMAIPPGEPADLVRKDFIKYYKKLGREKFIEVLKLNKNATIKQLKNVFNSM